MPNSERFSLPLFPLGSVLFPGMFLPLHIFEDRYRTMINQCLDNDQPFGVVLIADGEEVGAPAEPFDIGTIAKIVQAQRFDDGRLTILILGSERFKAWDHVVTDEGYLLGTVSEVSGGDGDLSHVMEDIRQLKSLLSDYLALIADAENAAMHEIQAQLADEPETLSFQIASIIAIEPTEKQNLLEITNTDTRLAREIKILEREIELLKEPKGSRQKLPWGGEVNLN